MSQLVLLLKRSCRDFLKISFLFISLLSPLPLYSIDLRNSIPVWTFIIISKGVTIVYVSVYWISQFRLKSPAVAVSLDQYHTSDMDLFFLLRFVFYGCKTQYIRFAIVLFKCWLDHLNQFSMQRLWVYVYACTSASASVCYLNKRFLKKMCVRNLSVLLHLHS